MPDRVRVLVYGGIGNAACDFYRRGQFVEHLAGLGIDLVPWTPPLLHPASYTGRWYQAIRDGVAQVDLSEVARAQVVLFARWSNTHAACTVCGAACDTPDGLAAHARSSGHDTLTMDPLLRLAVPALLANPQFRSSCAVVYDLDDDVFHQPAWAGHAAGLARELDLIELLIRAADLVTVSTPVVQSLLQPMTSRIHVVRNAVAPELYHASADAPSVLGNPRVLFYGADVRQRDYAVCARAVDACVGPEGRRVWLGSDSPAVRALVDEAHPPVAAGPTFAATLVGLRPHIGLAPLQPTEFAAAKSELHWLEYTLAGAATIASKLPGPGPYDVIRGGEDGLLVARPEDWGPALTRLISSPDLRAELVARARERVLGEYQTSARVREWAAVYHWAATHPGIGPRL
jgi:hypothetical protein